MNLRSMAAMAAASALAAGAASASVLYDNGPLDGVTVGWTINFGFAVSDSFTLKSAATVTGVTFGAWALPGDSISSIDWGITSTPGDYADTATAAVTSGPTAPNGLGYDVGVDSFSVGAVSLAAGTYFLVLQNASATNRDVAYWDQNSGPSTATENMNGSISSETFQILGSAVPEPSSWALMIAGVCGVGGLLRRRRSGTLVAG